LRFRRYIVYRLLTMVAVIFILLTFIFFAIHIIPGDPIEAMVGEGATQEYIDSLRHRFGLDKPLIEQYFDYIVGVFTGNLGESLVYNAPVMSIIWNRAGVTIQLAVLAWFVSTFVGVFIGRYSAQKVGKVHDNSIRSVTLFLYAIPVYVLGILCQLIFGVYLGVLPVFGTHSVTVRPPRITGMILIDTLLAGNIVGFFDAALHFMLPVLVLSAHYIAITIRLTHSENAKQMKRTFCLLAQAKGLNKSEIIKKHAFRNALLPIVTLIGLQAGSLLTGSVLVETVFSLKGLGDLLFVAASMRDYILIQGVITVFVLITSVIGIIIDISYYFLDPRVRY